MSAVLIEASAMLASNRVRLADLAVKANLPTIGWFSDMADAGLLMSLGPHLTDQYRRAAYFVDRLLKGAKPADIPVEQPTKSSWPRRTDFTIASPPSAKVRETWSSAVYLPMNDAW
jgi:ABC-type uncharacterized transport system substrate-binding protein